MNVLMVGSGDVELAPLLASDSYRVWRYERESDRATLETTRFDVAVLVAFSDALPRPVELLREIATLLAESGRIVLPVSRVARAAVRAAVFKGSVGEIVAPVPSDEDVAIHGRPSLLALLEEAGFRANGSAPASETVEATVVAARAFAQVAPPATAPEEPSLEERLAFANAELRARGDLFAEMTEGQRTLAREAARLHRAIDDRDREIADLRAEAASARERDAATADARARASDARDEAARAAATIADLERRLARAIAQTSTE